MSPTTVPWPPPPKLAACPRCGLQITQAAVELGFSLFDVVGNVWQWLETPIYPFGGFEVHPIYDDFTTPTFDERHNLIKGGSWISCGNEAAPV